MSVEDTGTRDGQEEINASKAPLLEHLIELRTRLIYAVGAFFVMFLLCFTVSKQIYNILLWPFVSVVGAGNAKTIYTHLLEKFFVDIKVAMFGAAFCRSRSSRGKSTNLLRPVSTRTSERLSVPT